MTKLFSIPQNLKGKRVLLRVDFNLPMKGGGFLGQSRLLKTLPTIKILKKRGAKVVLMTHLEVHGKNPSARPLLKIIKKHFKDAKFADGITGFEVQQKISALRNGGIILLENLRLDKGEKNNSSDFAKKLSLLGDIYVNEAFSASHRPHASIVGLPKLLPSFAGSLFIKELKSLSEFINPPKNFFVILGGNKLSTKIPLLSRFLRKADRIFVGGLMMVPVFSVLGLKVGRTAREKNVRKFALKLAGSSKVLLPNDLVVGSEWGCRVVRPDELAKNEIIYDIGPSTIENIGLEIKKSRFIFWNGPLGNIEKGFEKGTKSLVKILARSRRRVIVGGGDTVGFLERHNLTKGFYLISTGGGATLEYLAKGTLPGIDALRQRKKHV